MDPITAFLLKAAEFLLSKIKSGPKQPFRFKNEELNQELKNYAINANNPNVFIIEKGAHVYFGNVSTNAEVIKELLSKGSNSELVYPDFEEEYKDYSEYNKTHEFPFPFVNELSAKFKGLIKASQYIKDLYEAGDRDIAAQRKEELGRDNIFVRHFCNLYTAGYIPEALGYINDIGLRDKEIIEKILVDITAYESIFFVHKKTSEAEIIEKISDLIKQNKKYIAVHGAGSNVSKVKKIGQAYEESLKGSPYVFKEKPTPSQEAPNGVARHSIFIFNNDGERIYNEFNNGSFKGFS